MLDMEYVGRVMRPAMMFNICQHARTLITGGLHDLTVQCGQGRCHEVIPGRLISGLSQLFPNNEVAHGLYAHHTETSGKRFVLGEADIFAGHVLGQPGSFRVALGADRFFHLAVPLLLSPIRGGHKPIQTGEVEQDNWLQVLGTAERSQVDQRVRHQLHPIVPLLDTFKAEQQPLELVLPRKGPLDAHA